ncbi:hypothetical protein GCM10011591_16140 [Nocardia camponoti]|uniref:Uncharacterized protein n=1 Tax=Nocardia camponoti TaxID=1616106 RepID=A0A917QD33_9NOCA|nr:hypothetical protein GCM10011591_16140 [Nocardia camponoti]
MNTQTVKTSQMASFVMSASRGVLAPQGTGLSGVDFTPIRHLDKPNAGWQPNAVAAPAAANVGNALEFAGEIRLRVHPATVYRSRQS